MAGKRGNGAVDPVDAAVAAVEQKANAIEMLHIPVTITSTQRPFSMDIPADMTVDELAEVAGWMLTQVRMSIIAREAQKNMKAGGRIMGLDGKPLS